MKTNLKTHIKGMALPDLREDLYAILIEKAGRGIQEGKRGRNGGWGRGVQKNTQMVHRDVRDGNR